MAPQELHAVLPGLRGGFRIPNQVGVWDGRASDDLEALSANLVVGDSVGEINSIPDVWARPILFQMALCDAPAHPNEPQIQQVTAIHKRVLGEWRGLLAVLALKDFRNINDINEILVKLPPNPAKGSSAGFVDVAAELKPSTTLASNVSWSDVTIIRYGSKPIGMLSPTTLVCTATDYTDRIDASKVDWFVGGILTDPVSRLAPWEKTELAKWLRTLKEFMSRHPALDSSSTLPTTIARLLGAYIRDLDEAVENITTSALQVPPSANAGFFDQLQRPVAADAGSQEGSDVRLVSSIGKKPGCDILVLDPAIATQWETQPQFLRAWSNISLKEAVLNIEANSTTPKTHLRGRQLPNVEWRTPKEFFTDKLTVVWGADAFPGTLSGSGSRNLQRGGYPVSPILPFQAELLEYLSATDLASRLKFAPGSGDSVVVQLRLPLSSIADGGSRDFVVEEVFTGDRIQSLGSPPLLEVWPNFRSVRHELDDSGQQREVDAWKTYYTYYSRPGNTCYATPFLPSGTSAERTISSDSFGISREVTRTEKFPEALVCKFGANNLESIGLLLLPPPTTHNQTDKTVVVGVDFGTTTTNAFSREGESEPKPVVFQAGAERFLSVTGDKADRGRMYMEFLPNETETSRTMLTIYHKIARDQGMRPILDGHIFFVKVPGAVGENLSNLMINLKWGGERERLGAKAFLEQLCLQTSTEVACLGGREISWRFSFPSAFSKGDVRDFQAIWVQITDTCSERTGIKAADPTSKSESVAAASFFARKYEASLERGAICLDIGGGTSDVSVWQGRNTLRLHTSLLFAGRSLLLSPLRQKPEILEGFQVIDSATLRNLRDFVEDEQRFFAQADAIVSRFGKQLMERLPTRIGDKSVADLLSIIEEGLCGLFYYLGLVVRSLHQQGRYEARIPHIYVGGNGSQLLHWCGGMRFTQNSEFGRRLKEMLRSGSAFAPEQSEILISDLPKGEVAYGLVVDRPLTVAVEESECISGEAFVFDKEPGEHAWDTRLDAATIKRCPKLVGPPAEFQRFLSALNPKSPTSTEVLRTLVDEVNQELADIHAQEEEKIRPIPIFLIALNRYVRYRTKEWGGKAH